MSRRVPWSVAASALLLAGCSDDGASSSPSPVTIELGSLPGTLQPPPTVEPTSTTSESPSTTTTSTTSTTDTPTTTTVPFPEVITGDVGDDGSFRPSSLRWDTVTDDTGRVTVRLPDVWADRSTTPGTLADGRSAPYIAAAPQLTGFLDGYGAAGLSLVVLPAGTEPSAALEGYRFADACGGGATARFRRDALSGEYAVWTDCGATGTDIVTVAARPADGSSTVVVLVQVLNDFDVEVLDVALSSLRVRRED